MSTENEGRKAREWVAAIYKQTGLCGGLFESEAEANRSGNTNNEKVHVREVLPSEPVGSARTFEEWWNTQKYTGFSYEQEWRTVDNAIVIPTKTAVTIWNAAREGMVPAPRDLTPFERWWLSLPTHAGSDPDNWRIVAGQLVHLATAVQVWKECEAFRSGGAAR